MSSAIAQDDLITALSQGKVDFSAYYRYENVDDERFTEEANANTVRLTLGYKTGEFHGLGLNLQFEHIEEVFTDDFAHPSKPNPDFPVVADPEGTEVLQGYLSYNGLGKSQFKLGRQLISYRKAPFHRFIGTVPWRQKWQTMDAVSFQNSSLPNTQFSYAYVWNINRIFGEDAPDPLNNFDSNSHFFNVKYTGFSNLALEAYSYLLEFDNAEPFSTNTYGLRANGSIPLNEKAKVIYTGEYAYQNDAGDNPNDIGANYWLAEAGLKFKFDGPVNLLLAKVGYEVLEGDGGNDRFVTILGTNHAYQGWADRFLITPGDGIKDLYVTFVLNAFKIKFIAAYHDLQSDNKSYDYGSEINLLATRTFMKYYTLGLKYASYDADKNADNNGATAADVDKFWAFAQIKF